MKKGIVIAVGILMLFALATSCYAAGEREARIVNQYRKLCAQEKETEQLLEGTRVTLREIQGRLRERRVADKEIQALMRQIADLDKQIEELKKEEEPKLKIGEKVLEEAEEYSKKDFEGLKYKELKNEVQPSPEV